jgi:hypothetical protein
VLVAQNATTTKEADHMSNEITRWGSGNQLARHHARTLATIDQAADVAEVTVSAINKVTQRALFETMQTQMLRRQAEALAPDGAELYALIATAGALESAQVVGDVRRRIGW